MRFSKLCFHPFFLTQSYYIEKPQTKLVSSPLNLTNIALCYLLYCKYSATFTNISVTMSVLGVFLHEVKKESIFLKYEGMECGK